MKVESAAALQARFGAGGPVVSARAPGRVNLIGEHTDYNDGFVLPTAIGDYLEVSVRCRSDRRIRCLAMDRDAEFADELGTAPAGSPPHWSRYLCGLSHELHQLGLVDRGFDLSFRGTVPPGAGLSSSAALEVAATLALARAFDFTLDPLECARLCQRVEHRWVGVQCGIMDQVASRLGRQGQAILLDCRSLDWREVPLDLAGYRLLIVYSGIQRRLEASAYNQRRAECQEAVSQLGAVDPAVTSLRDVDPQRHAASLDELEPTVAARAHHVLAENDRVLQAAHFLADGDLVSFGELMVASHRSLSELYAVSHPLLDLLVDTALGIPGVLGARMTGAGFGGCTITLCEEAGAEAVSRAMREVLQEDGRTGWVRELGRVTPAGVVEENP